MEGLDALTQVTPELDFLWSVVDPDDGIVASTPDQDGERDDDEVEGIKEQDISKVGEENTSLLYNILNTIHHKDENVANDELGDDEHEINRELIECENVPSISPPEAGLL